VLLLRILVACHVHALCACVVVQLSYQLCGLLETAISCRSSCIDKQYIAISASWTLTAPLPGISLRCIMHEVAMHLSVLKVYDFFIVVVPSPCSSIHFDKFKLLQLLWCSIDMHVCVDFGEVYAGVSSA
jgi:hypothetical protein